MSNLEEFKSNLEKFLDSSFHNLQQFYNDISSEILQSFEKYKQIGENVQSEEVQNLHKILDDFLYSIENIFKTFDLELTNFFIEFQKNTEGILNQIQNLLGQFNITELQTKINEISRSILDLSPEMIKNKIQDILKTNFAKNKTESPSEEDLPDDISIMFSESDTKK